MKTGRNAPCPCGSGRKYKHCCGGKTIPFTPQPGNSRTEQMSDNLKQQLFSSMGVSGGAELDKAMEEYKEYCESLPDGVNGPTFMEYRGMANAASESIGEMQKQAEGRVFGSLEEMQDFARQHTATQNNAPLDSFLGLSPAQMHDILQKPFSQNEHIIIIREDPDNDLLLATPVIRYALHIMQEAGSDPKGMKATQTGCFNRKFVRGFYDTFLKKKSRFQDFVPKMEAEVPQLEKIHSLLTDCKYIRKQKGYFLLTRKGKEAVESGQVANLYTELLKYYIETFNWLYFSRFNDLHGFVQQSAVFLMYMLKERGKDYISLKEFASVYLKAFPHYKKEVDQFSSYRRDDFVIDVLFLDSFCTFFGLVDSREQPEQEDNYFTRKDYKQSKLFGNLFEWKI